MARQHDCAARASFHQSWKNRGKVGDGSPSTWWPEAARYRALENPDYSQLGQRAESMLRRAKGIRRVRRKEGISLSALLTIAVRSRGRDARS